MLGGEIDRLELANRLLHDFCAVEALGNAADKVRDSIARSTRAPADNAWVGEIGCQSSCEGRLGDLSGLVPSAPTLGSVDSCAGGVGFTGADKGGVGVEGLIGRGFVGRFDARLAEVVPAAAPSVAPSVAPRVAPSVAPRVAPPTDASIIDRAFSNSSSDNRPSRRRRRRSSSENGFALSALPRIHSRIFTMASQPITTTITSPSSGSPMF